MLLQVVQNYFCGDGIAGLATFCEFRDYIFFINLPKAIFLNQVKKIFYLNQRWSKVLNDEILFLGSYSVIFNNKSTASFDILSVRINFHLLNDINVQKMKFDFMVILTTRFEERTSELERRF